MIYAVTVDPTAHSDSVWASQRELCEAISERVGDQTDLGTTWQVWAATRQKDVADVLAERLTALLGDGYVAVEEVRKS